MSIRWIIALALIFSSVPVYPEDLRWPLDIPIRCSSSFAEFRGLRFHAGVDLRTEGRTGFPVYAPADGFVSRLKVQHRGGGYSIYLDFPQPQIRSVFMHLEEYAEPMATYIREKQERSGNRYGIDDSFGADRFRVKKGQIIAWSGESGVGPPHLHFELRRLNDDPISPPLAGMKIADSRPPKLLDLWVDPLSPTTRIDGGFVSLRFPLNEVSPGEYRPAREFSVSGKAGLQLGLIDFGEGGNRSGVESIILKVDGKPLLERRFATFSYEQNPQCPYVYDFPRSHLSGTGYVYTLFRWPFETLPFSSGAGAWAGCLEGLAPGGHDLRIDVRDFGGNPVAVSGRIQILPEIQCEQVIDGPLQAQKVHYQATAVVVDCQNKGAAVSSGKPVAGIPVNAVRCVDSQGVPANLPAQVTKTTVQIAFPIASRWAGGARCGDQLVLPPHVFLDRAGGVVEGPAGFRAVLPAGCLNLPILARLDITNAQPVPGGTAKRGRILPIGPVIQFFPPDLVTDKALVLQLPLLPGEPPRPIGVYSYRQGGKYGYEGGECKNGVIALSTRAPDPVLLAKDVVPPAVTPKGRRTIKHLGSCLVFVADDIGEGFDGDGIRATLDGKELDTDSDPDKDEVYVLVPPKKPGRGALRVTDRAGNTREVTFRP